MLRLPGWRCGVVWLASACLVALVLLNGFSVSAFAPAAQSFARPSAGPHFAGLSTTPRCCRGAFQALVRPSAHRPRGSQPKPAGYGHSFGRLSSGALRRGRRLLVGSSRRVVRTDGMEGAAREPHKSLGFSLDLASSHAGSSRILLRYELVQALCFAAILLGSVLEPLLAPYWFGFAGVLRFAFFGLLRPKELYTLCVADVLVPRVGTHSLLQCAAATIREPGRRAVAYRLAWCEMVWRCPG